MFFQWWRANASVFGTAAQWAGGLASFGTFCVALWGVSKAVPYFENLVLREQKAELEISRRALDLEKRKLAVRVLCEQLRRTYARLFYPAGATNLLGLPPLSSPTLKMYFIQEAVTMKTLHEVAFDPELMGLLDERDAKAMSEMWNRQKPKDEVMGVVIVPEMKELGDDKIAVGPGENMLGHMFVTQRLMSCFRYDPSMGKGRDPEGPRFSPRPQ
jgi:hypothetical protein